MYYKYKIISTIEVTDEGDDIRPGDLLYDGSDHIFVTAAAAIAAGETVLTGIDGGRAFNAARDSADVRAINAKSYVESSRRADR